MSEAAVDMRRRLGANPSAVSAAAKQYPLVTISTTAGAPSSNKAVVFRSLFDEYWPKVHRHLSCYLDNSEEVNEIAAEVFVVAWKKLDAGKPMSLRWFIRTADNKLRDVDRKAHSRSRAMEALSRGLRSAADAIHPLDALALQEALRSLSARERQVVVLTYWDELSAGEIADILRSSQPAVWTTLTRARAKLRAQLEPREGRS
ncbi:RNA polymerase sigma factor [Microbacterium sp. BLY]|uniref:RNA polymerase sigma factor n=1 Tax=Microbacterium sp. BLY TaxID=2823280 RepID=UPI001B31A979|nr:sigma-70 family RNA polymerase sigma factor [Microbacterium sp. BLY]MBP3976924.1 sigma-70 family RNA polymerase sigma factor [Microbacterium sp. BLY]